MWRRAVLTIGLVGACFVCLLLVVRSGSAQTGHSAVEPVTAASLTTVAGIPDNHS